MSRRAEGRARDVAGFTLVEVMVAFAVMAVILGVLYRGVVQTGAGAAAFSAHLNEEIVARSLLAEFAASRDLHDGSYAGNRDGRRWTLKASPMDLRPQLPTGLASQDASKTTEAAAPATRATRAEEPKPIWVAQRLTLQVATGARPLRTETIHLVRRPPPEGDER